MTDAHVQLPLAFRRFIKPTTFVDAVWSEQRPPGIGAASVIRTVRSPVYEMRSTSNLWDLNEIDPEIFWTVMAERERHGLMILLPSSSLLYIIDSYRTLQSSLQPNMRDGHGTNYVKAHSRVEIRLDACSKYPNMRLLSLLAVLHIPARAVVSVGG
jgi:hypothetical protein